MLASVDVRDLAPWRASPHTPATPAFNTSPRASHKAVQPEGGTYAHLGPEGSNGKATLLIDLLDAGALRRELSRINEAPTAFTGCAKSFAHRRARRTRPTVIRPGRRRITSCASTLSASLRLALLDDLAADRWRRAAPTRYAPETARTGGESLARLDDQTVPCVAGLTFSVPIYRQLIERTGGRFMRHGGGEEDKPVAMVAAADNAYWRLKNHCKHSGKRCVFFDRPSNAGLKRALLTLEPAGVNEAAPDLARRLDETTP